MFIRIGKLRIKLASIGEFQEKGQAQANNKWYVELKVSGKVRMIAFDTEKEYNHVVEYLDKALKVIVV